MGVWENGKFRRGYRVPVDTRVPERIGSEELKKEVSAS